MLINGILDQERQADHWSGHPVIDAFYPARSAFIAYLWPLEKTLQYDFGSPRTCVDK